MATGESSNLVQEFEEAFQKCLTSLTEEDDLYHKDPESVQKDIDDKVTQFTDVARQLETFFLQKRFLIYNHKPEMILKEDTGELKAELVRKDELIRKHYEKLGKWKEMLADAQQVTSQTTPAPGARPQGPGSQTMGGGAGGPGLMMGGSVGPGPGGQTPHGSFVPGPNYPRMPSQHNNMYGGPGPGGQQNLQGPLAYLERTTSNIGGPGAPGMPNR